MDTLTNHAELFWDLDRRDINAGLVQPLSQLLSQHFSNLDPSDKWTLAYFNDFVQSRVSLSIDHTIRDVKREFGDGFIQDHSVVSTILRSEKKLDSQVISLLVGILVNYALESSRKKLGNQDRIIKLSSAIRGLINPRKKQTLVALTRLASIQSILEFAHKLDEVNENTSLRYNAALDLIWRSWLGDTVKRWLFHDNLKSPQLKPATLRHTTLRSSLEAPLLQLPLLDEVDQDDLIDVINLEVPGLKADENVPARSRLIRAKALNLDRASCGDLASNCDAWIPDELVCKFAQKSLKRASDALKVSQNEVAERFLAVAMAIASGLREIDFSALIWNNSTGQNSLELDPQNPIIYRRILRPDQAVNPAAEMSTLLEPITDVFEWPIPVELYELLCKFKIQSKDSSNAVFPGKADTSRNHYSFQEVLKELDPQNASGMQRIRLALASKLALKFGTEIAQLVMSDGFSHSVAPAYYSALPGCQVSEFILTVQSQWFGSEPAQHSFSENYIGSRLVVSDQTAQLWPKSLRANKGKYPSNSGDAVRQAWIARRDFLAASLCAATGHRPINSLGQIFLYDVIPEYGLIVLSDKQCDALRSTRIAATGKLWLLSLQRYLQSLQEIIVTDAESRLAIGAKSILMGEAPLFSAPNENGAMTVLTAEGLKMTMPMELKKTANYYRHRLCQFLQANEVAPELRHAHLGWMVTSAYTTAEMSPLAPKDIANRIGHLIDEMLVKDGWFESLKVIPNWTWRGIPMPAVPDWAEISRQHENDHKALYANLKNALKEKGLATQKSLMPYFKNAIDRSIYELKLDVNAVRLEWRNTNEGKPIELNQTQLSRILDFVYDDAGRELTTLETVVAQNTLYQLITGGMRRGLLIAPTPHHHRISPKLTESPFPLGMGLAVRQAQVLYSVLLKRAKGNSKQDRLPSLALGVMAFSPYRKADLAIQIVVKSHTALRSRTNNSILRLDIDNGNSHQQIVLAGIIASWVGKLSTKKSPARFNESIVNQWLAAQNKTIEFNGLDTIAQVESLFNMTGRVELSGIERMLMLENCGTATVKSLRSIANEENWPLQTMHFELREKPCRQNEREEMPTRSSSGIDFTSYRRLTELLNENTSAGKLSQDTDGKYGWRTKLEQKLRSLIEDIENQTNVKMLASYVLHRLKYGGVRVSKLSRKTLHKEITQFGRPLLRSLNGGSLLSQSASSLFQLYSEVLIEKTDKSRPHAVEEIDRFHQYLVECHGMPELAFTDLYAMAGKRNTSSDSGLFTPKELDRIGEQLVEDLDNERAKLISSPESTRICALSILMYVLLEASGVRPQSVHGLTLGDIKLFGFERDFIHIRRTGEYGMAKTVTSLGYVPLEGPLWLKYREWVADWLEQEIALIEDTAWFKRPVFAIFPGSRNRFNQSVLTQRIDQLAKWVTGDLKARTYWLRKNRITQRLRAAFSGEKSMARDVHAALSASGHSSIGMPVAHYISDSAVIMSHYLNVSSQAKQADLLAVSGLPKSPMYAMWSRNNGRGKFNRVASVLNQINVPYLPVPNEIMVNPPKTKSTVSILPKHVNNFAQLLAIGATRDQAILKSGITYEQADRLDGICQQLLLDRGKSIWKLPPPFPRNSRIKPARIIVGSESLNLSLNQCPSEDMLMLAAAWYEHASIKKVQGSDTILYLKSVERIEAAKRVLLASPSLKLRINSINSSVYLATRAHEPCQHSHKAIFEWTMAIIWVYGKFMKV